MPKRFEIVIFALALALSVVAAQACDDGQTPSETPDAADTGEDATTGDTADAPDTIPPEDAANDLTADATEDATADATEDATADATEDATADATEDATADATEDATSGCIDPQPSSGSGGHRAGQSCLNCHASQPPSRRWTVAGTLYDDADGTNPLVGATIVVVDDDQNEIRLVTGNNGNFYTTQAVTFPLSVRASRCPDDASMPNPVNNGSCNSCHSSGSRIHLP